MHAIYRSICMYVRGIGVGVVVGVGVGASKPINNITL